MLARLPALLVLGIAVYYAVWGGEYSVPDLFRLRAASDAEQLRLARTVAAADSLRAVAAKLENDRATIETVARERFGMIADGETLYRFVELPPPAPDSARLAATP